VRRTALEVADIFRDHGAAWRSANAGHVSLEQLKVMSAIERCRTAALGGHVARCEDCAHTLIAYNSCRNRHCPKCQGAAAREWLAEREAELLPVPYFHVVFTLPAALRNIAYQNKAVVYDLLFKASAETLITIAADPKHLGARIGFISVLHTWGSTLIHHPHVHMIVPGGGFSPDGSKWIACRPRYFLTVEVLSALFRRLFLEMLLAAHEAGRLQFFGDFAALANKTAFDRCLKPLWKSKWVVYCKRPFAGPKQVLHYLSRYTHRVAISNLRRPEWRHLQVQGLSARRVCPLQKDDPRNQRVHPPLPRPRSAQGLAPHPALRTACQSQLCCQPRASARVARDAIPHQRASTVRSHDNA
jgi:Putative transposase/Transposase zinc-binding domain